MSPASFVLVAGGERCPVAAVVLLRAGVVALCASLWSAPVLWRFRWGSGARGEIAARGRRCKSGRGLPHSKTLRARRGHRAVRQLVECASPLALWVGRRGAGRDRGKGCRAGGPKAVEDSCRQARPHSKTLRARRGRCVVRQLGARSPGSADILVGPCESPIKGRRERTVGQSREGGSAVRILPGAHLAGRATGGRGHGPRVRWWSCG